MGMSMSMSMSMTMLISIASFFLLCTSSSSSFLFGEALQQTTCRRILTQAPVPLLASLPATSSRRTWFETIATTTLSGVAVLVTIPSAAASHAGAATYPPTITTDAASLIQSIQDAQTTLGLLLDNWERATTQCNYADVPRDLLSADNKQQLLEKASTFALFDKSVSIESCKTTNRLVRDYIGVTGKGPLVGIEKKIKQALELVDDPEQLDAFVVGTYMYVRTYVCTYVLTSCSFAIIVELLLKEGLMDLLVAPCTMPNVQ
jgi:hypothetical protein